MILKIATIILIGINSANAESVIPISNATPYKELTGGVTVHDRIAYLYGEITPGIDRVFSRIPMNVDKLILTSPGGLVAEGESIATQVKNRNMSTIVIGYCYSACTVIFAAGRQKIAKNDADFIIHSTRSPCRSGRDECSYSSDEISHMNYSNKLLISYYDKFGVDGKFTRSAVRYPQKQNEKRFGPDFAMPIRLTHTPTRGRVRAKWAVSYYGHFRHQRSAFPAIAPLVSEAFSR